MKRYLYLPAVLLTLFCACCKEDVPNPDDGMNVPGLPLATQSGANTLGFLLNGVPWTPQGTLGVPALSIDYDPGFNNGIIGISANRVISGSRENLGIGIIDSLNFKVAPFSIPLTRTSLYRFGFLTTSQLQCWLFSDEVETTSSGLITITRHDRTARVIAGTFSATLIKTGCDTIRITKGRFDFKF